jgi:hypothetical protein
VVYFPPPNSRSTLLLHALTSPSSFLCHQTKPGSLASRDSLRSPFRTFFESFECFYPSPKASFTRDRDWVVTVPAYNPPVKFALAISPRGMQEVITTLDSQPHAHSDTHLHNCFSPASIFTGPDGEAERPGLPITNNLRTRKEAEVSSIETGLQIRSHTWPATYFCFLYKQ